VEVFINDAYNGLYCMTEKVDRKQLKLKKLETSELPPTVTQRGGLYKGYTWASGTFGGNASFSTSYNNNSETWSGFEVKYPDFGDGEPIDWKPLVDAITVSSHLTSNADFKSRVATSFDLPVFLDYYLFIELMLASDNQGKNTYFSVYNQKKSSMVTITPWDCDGTWGRRWDGSSGLTGANQDFDTFIATHEHAQNNLFLRLKSLNHNDYRNKLKDRYKELRGTHFSYENLMGRFERYHEQFIKSGADVRERNKWFVANFANEMQFLSTWIQDRLSYLDNQYLGGPYVPPPTPPNPPTSIENHAASEIVFAPNPVRDVLTISHSTTGDIIRIVSLQGIEMTRIQSNGNDVLVDMTRYAPGIYLLKIGGNVSKIINL
jgi:spore coat protein CotH